MTFVQNFCADVPKLKAVSTCLVARIEHGFLEFNFGRSHSNMQLYNVISNGTNSTSAGNWCGRGCISSDMIDFCWVDQPPISFIHLSRLAVSIGVTKDG